MNTMMTTMMITIIIDTKYSSKPASASGAVQVSLR